MWWGGEQECHQQHACGGDPGGDQAAAGEAVQECRIRGAGEALRRSGQRGAGELPGGGTRRRVKVIGRLPDETSCLTLVWAVLDRASRGWRGFTMTAACLRLLRDLRRSLLEPSAQLRPRTVTTARPADGAQTVSAIA